jgi:hypothetical protein
MSPVMLIASSACTWLQASGSKGKLQRAESEHIRGNPMLIGVAKIPELVPSKSCISPRLPKFAETPWWSHREQRTTGFLLKAVYDRKYPLTTMSLQA